MIKTAMLQKLEKHQHIAYDLDGTLFGIYGKILSEYITDNPNKTHSIITSRQSYMQPQSNIQLQCIFGNNLNFKHIIHSPSERLEGHDAVHYYKGVECNRIGATALVDDWQFHEAACNAYNVDFIFVHGLV